MKNIVICFTFIIINCVFGKLCAGFISRDKLITLSNHQLKIGLILGNLNHLKIKL